MRAGPMSTRLKLTLLSGALLVAAALPSSAQAAGTTTINFDNLPAFTEVREQYAADGVRFGPPTASPTISPVFICGVVVPMAPSISLASSAT